MTNRILEAERAIAQLQDALREAEVSLRLARLEGDWGAVRLASLQLVALAGSLETLTRLLADAAGAPSESSLYEPE